MNEDPDNRNTLRTTFIAMLFALVVATIAQKFADILYVITDSWVIPLISIEVYTNLIDNKGLLLASLTHAFLGLLLVSVSWVGWSNSAAAGHKEKISSLFSFPFLLLLIEVTMVTVYFGIATSNELDLPMLRMNSWDTGTIKASATPEALQLMTVFVLYFIWDVIADVISSPLVKKDSSDSVNTSLTWLTGILTYSSISFIGIILCYIVYRVYPENPEPYHAILGDLALMSVIGMFHAGKSLEGFMVKIFPWEATRENSLRQFPLTRNQKLKLLVPSISYLALITTI